MTKSVRDMLTHESRELIDAYERCKWLEAFQPDADSTVAEKEHLEALSSNIHYAFWNNARRIKLVESLTSEVERLRGVIEEACLDLDVYSVHSRKTSNPLSAIQLRLRAALQPQGGE